MPAPPRSARLNTSPINGAGLPFFNKLGCYDSLTSPRAERGGPSKAAVAEGGSRTALRCCSAAVYQRREYITGSKRSNEPMQSACSGGMLIVRHSFHMR